VISILGHFYHLTLTFLAWFTGKLCPHVRGQSQLVCILLLCSTSLSWYSDPHHLCTDATAFPPLPLKWLFGARRTLSLPSLAPREDGFLLFPSVDGLLAGRANIITRSFHFIYVEPLIVEVYRNAKLHLPFIRMRIYPLHEPLENIELYKSSYPRSSDYPTRIVSFHLTPQLSLFRFPYMRLSPSSSLPPPPSWHTPPLA
jgi:hypothetical protein